VILKVRISKPVASAIRQVCRENKWNWADVAEEVLRSWAEGLDELPEGLPPSPRVDTIPSGSKKSRKGRAR